MLLTELFLFITFLPFFLLRFLLRTCRLVQGIQVNLTQHIDARLEFCGTDFEYTVSLFLKFYFFRSFFFHVYFLSFYIFVHSCHNLFLHRFLFFFVHRFLCHLLLFHFRLLRYIFLHRFFFLCRTLVQAIEVNLAQGFELCTRSQVNFFFLLRFVLSFNRHGRLITVLVLSFLNKLFRFFLQILVLAELLYKFSILFFGDFSIRVCFYGIPLLLQEFHHRCYSYIQVSCYFVQSYCHFFSVTSD